MKLLIFFLVVLTLTTASFGQKSQTKPLAGNFTATSLDGKTFNLAELKGKVVLVTFWSTKCPICAAEIPKLNQLAASYKDKDVVFLGLTTDNDAKVKQYLKRKPFDFNLLPNSFGILLEYADKDGDGNVTMGYPALYLINQKGEIEVKASGFDKTALLDAQIARLLKIK